MEPRRRGAADGEVTRSRHRAATHTGYAWAIGAVVVCTGLAGLLFPLVAEANLIMVYLLGVMLVAVRFGRGPALTASALSVLAFDVCFVPPYLSLAVSDTRYLVTFGVMLLAAVIISDLAARQRQARVLAQQREERTRLLYALSQAYAGAAGVEAVRAAAAEHLGALFTGRVVIFLPASGNPPPSEAAGADATLAADVPGPAVDLGVAQWVFDHGSPAGAGTATLPGAQGVYVPLLGARGRVGVLGLRQADPGAVLDAEQLQLLQTCASQTALALERARLAEAVQRAEVAAASERARAALLASVSHDLRTPLAVVMGALSSMLVRDITLDPATREQLTTSAYREAAQLDHLVGQLLAMTRLEAGPLPLRREWQSLEELIGAALAQLDDQLVGRPVAVVVPPELPLVALDGRLVTQVIVNLVANALTYTPAATPIRLRTSLVRDRQSLPLPNGTGVSPGQGPAVLVEVADAGPGLPPGDEGRVFEKFYRGPGVQPRGVGLGLAICRGIVAAHRGAIWAEAGAGGGAVFRFWLPIDDDPPQVRPEAWAPGRDGAVWRHAS